MKLLLPLLALLIAAPVFAQVPQMPAENKQPHATLLHFWATWCGPCVLELPSIDRLARDMAPKQVTVFAMSEDAGGAPAVKEFMATHPGLDDIKILFDPSQAMGKQQKVDSIPTTIVIGPNGKEVARYVGSHDWDDPAMRAELEKALAGN